MSILKDTGKIKFWEGEKFKDILIILVIVITGISSFGLGRLSASKTNRSPVEIKYPSDYVNISTSQASAINSQKTEEGKAEGEFVASKRGKKYYPTNCSAAKNIKGENRINFESSQKAEEAGYTASSSC